MNEQYNTALDFLEDVWRQRFAVNRAASQIELMQARCKHVVTCLEPCVSKTHDPYSKENAIVALTEKQAELQRLEQQLEQKEKEAEAFLSKISDERCRAILQLRYVDRLKWNDIQRKLEGMTFYYSERQIYNLHKRAVKEAEDLWNHIAERSK